MDVMMPGLDGPSTLRRLRADPRSALIPIIFLTAKVLPGELAQLLQLGALGVIAKPFDPAHLCADLHARWQGRDAPSEADSHAPGSARIAPQPSALDIEFITRARKDAIRLREMLGRAVDGDLTALEEVERIAHGIHGTAAMFGLPGVSDCGGVIERLAERAIGAAGQAEPGTQSRLLQELIDGTASLAAAVSRRRGGSLPKHSGPHPRGSTSVKIEPLPSFERTPISRSNRRAMRCAILRPMPWPSRPAASLTW